jgi:hypothetical protein
MFSRFFTPTPAFWDWLEEKAQGRTIVDIGCGRGDLVRECNARGLKAMGIDPCYDLFQVQVPSDLSSCILPMGVEDCLDLIGSEDMLLLCCRPCHDGFPIHVVETRRRSPFYYVGFDSNLERDLGSLTEFNVEFTTDPTTGKYGLAGIDGEKVWEVAKF